jgi:hypothetical protein
VPQTCGHDALALFVHVSPHYIAVGDFVRSPAARDASPRYEDWQWAQALGHYSPSFVSILDIGNKRLDDYRYSVSWFDDESYVYEVEPVGDVSGDPEPTALIDARRCTGAEGIALPPRAARHRLASARIITEMPENIQRASLGWLGPTPHLINEGGWVLVFEDANMQPLDIRRLEIPVDTQSPPIQTVEDDLRRMGLRPLRIMKSFYYAATWVVTIPPDAP